MPTCLSPVCSCLILLYPECGLCHYEPLEDAGSSLIVLYRARPIGPDGLFISMDDNDDDDDEEVT